MIFSAASGGCSGTCLGCVTICRLLVLPDCFDGVGFPGRVSELYDEQTEKVGARNRRHRADWRESEALCYVSYSFLSN